MNLHLVVFHVNGDIRHMQEVVGEILLDDITLVPKANNEVIDAVGRIDFHDVPDDGPATDLYHWLWLEVGLLTDPGTKPAGQDNAFHIFGLSPNKCSYFLRKLRPTRVLPPKL